MPESAGHIGVQGWEMHGDEFFVFVKQIFCWHLVFVKFGISISVIILKIEFEKDNFCRGIKLNFQRLTKTPSLGQQVEVRTHNWLQGHAVDTWWSNYQFCLWDFRTYPCPKDMVGTWLGHFQLRNVSQDLLLYWFLFPHSSFGYGKIDWTLTIQQTGCKLAEMKERTVNWPPLVDVICFALVPCSVIYLVPVTWPSFFIEMLHPVSSAQRQY